MWRLTGTRIQSQCVTHSERRRPAGCLSNNRCWGGRCRAIHGCLRRSTLGWRCSRLGPANWLSRIQIPSRSNWKRSERQRNSYPTISCCKQEPSRAECSEAPRRQSQRRASQRRSCRQRLSISRKRSISALVTLRFGRVRMLRAPAESKKRHSCSRALVVSSWRNSRLWRLKPW